MKRQQRTAPTARGPKGFTLIELLIGSTIMLVVIVAALAVYSKSNQISVDQQQYTELQHDVRSAMFLVMRDARMPGAGIPEQFNMFTLEGVDNEDQGAPSGVRPDRLRILGNIDVPLSLRIRTYLGPADVLDIEDFSFENYSYDDAYYANKFVLILPNPDAACRAGEVRQITGVTHASGGTNERLNFATGLAPGINPPGGLSGTCADSNNYNGGLVTFVDVRDYWLDVTGNFPGLTTGVNGYIGGGQGNIFYQTNNGVHNPIAQNIENFQVQYNGDFNDDGLLDGFQEWNAGWAPDQIARVRQIRVQLLGCTPRRFVSVSGRPDATVHNYRRPVLANSPAAATDDLHRRFLLESTSNVRNLSLGLYNTGNR
jgi:prepilin-type N-terminal cleavage/methylation domain-containing protein